MPPQTNRIHGRLLAPFALAAVFVALLLIVLGSSGGSGSEPPDSDSGSRAQGTSAGQAAPSSRRARGVYTVKSGDTLGSIAERSGTTVERLQELNPDLDAQSLVAGQKIKLGQ